MTPITRKQITGKWAAALMMAAALWGGTILSLTPDPVWAVTRDDNEQSVEIATKSNILPVTLPAGAFRSKSKEDIAKLADALRGISKRNNHEIGEVEVLAWLNAKDVKTAMTRALKAIDYGYASEPPLTVDGDKVTVFLSNSEGDKRNGFGMWIDHGSNLLLAWTTVAKEKDSKQDGKAASNGEAENEKSADNSKQERPAPPATKADGEADTTRALPRKSPANGTEGAENVDAIDLRADASTLCLNVMGRKMPPLPAMPPLAVKPNIVRGYVRDLKGRPLKGAMIGVRSTAIGGAYSGASAKTDANGYYEIQTPWGVASFYCAGYQTDYGDLIGAFGLHPTDGQTDGFASAPGLVKNWVLLPYGVGDRATAQDNPKYCGNYYGGTIVFCYHMDDSSGQKSALPANSEIEITLTPDGPCIDGSKARPIIIHRATDTSYSAMFYLNNIPVCPYKIKARMAGVGALRLRETGPYAKQAFGLTPKDATGEADLLLKVYDAQTGMATAAHGHWNACQIDLERP